MSQVAVTMTIHSQDKYFVAIYNPLYSPNLHLTLVPTKTNIDVLVVGRHGRVDSRFATIDRPH